MRRRGLRDLSAIVAAVVLAGCSAASTSAPSAGATGTPSATTATVIPATIAPSAVASTAPSATSPIANLGGWIAYQGLAASDDGIFLIRADGSNDHQIAADVHAPVRHPDFSRDGTKLAFDNLPASGVDQVWVAAADGSDAHPVGHCKAAACSLSMWEPSWSPDGTKLAIATGGGALTDAGPERFGIAILDLSTGKVTQVVDHPGADGQDHLPRWSPDGRHLVFWRGIGTNGGETRGIFVVSASGGTPKQLVDPALLAGDVDWSPSGDLLVFGTRPILDYDVGPSALYVVKPDGTGLRQISPTGSSVRYAQPRWTPDGRYVLYTRQDGPPTTRSIWILSLDGATDVSAATTPRISTHPVLQPVD